MNNIKKIALGLTVATFALGFSAFKNADSKTNSLASKTYYHVGNQYVDTQPVGLECLPDDFSCEIRFDGDNLPTVSNFAEGSTPSSPDYTSTPIQSDASYQ